MSYYQSLSSRGAPSFNTYIDINVLYILLDLMRDSSIDPSIISGARSFVFRLGHASLVRFGAHSGCTNWQSAWVTVNVPIFHVFLLYPASKIRVQALQCSRCETPVDYL